MAVKVGIIGGGPSGAICGYHLARAGIEVHLFERSPDREKPCGGGLTLRAIKALPLWPQLGVEHSRVNRFRLISPSLRCIDLTLTDPIRIVSRHQLDNALRRLAVTAGVKLVNQAVRKPVPITNGGWQLNGDLFDIAIGAGGINDPLARHLGYTFTGHQRGKAFGYFVPGSFPARIVCRFFPGFWAYAWWFPRSDHASFGIESLAGDFNALRARVLMQQFVQHDLHPLMPEGTALDLNNSREYAWAEPIPDAKLFARRLFNGADWLLLGDAAGLVDTLTGEGLPYAFISGSLAAEAILKGRLDYYTKKLKQNIIPELIRAAKMSPVFYSYWHLRLSLFVLAKSETMRSVTNDMAVGHLHYRDFKGRMLRDAPGIARDMVSYLTHRFIGKGALHAS